MRRWPRTYTSSSQPNTSSGRATSTSFLSPMMKRAKANKINRLKKIPFHRSGSKFREIDMFKDDYVRPRDEATEQLHLSLKTPLEDVTSTKDAGFHIQIETLVHALSRRLGKVSTSQVTTLTQEVADLKQKFAAQDVYIAAQDKAMAAHVGKKSHILQTM
ncbi:hypothetical protein D8674_031132 [Pyrus ussuriensis x Pyrus communis]|uniref:Uncharacterized protein n=1 Tax=Pyrus ussuriensis x Pyrus communis TaxID=2448454 RepID=A0A5N5F341_9ROSA|nr:hypothetical protein D8674_031132 [Pyrus ussuriensis x Pyrus communis]